MRQFFCFFIIVSVALGAVSCSGSEGGGGGGTEAVQCATNENCNRDSYCDLESPQRDDELGTTVFYCKKRKLCNTQADCPSKWRCKESEGLCITEREADGLLCKSNSDCLDPAYPKCNLASGECVPSSSYNGDDTYDEEDEEEDDTDNSGIFEDDTEDEGPDSFEPEEDDPKPDNDNSNENEPAGKVLMYDSFEDAEPKWTIEPASAEAPCWEIGVPTNGPAEAFNGSNVAATSLTGNYNDNCKDLLKYNQALSIPSSGKPAITFYGWVNIVGSSFATYDYVEVLVKKESEVWELVSGLYLSANAPSDTSVLDSGKTKITGKIGTAYYKFTGDLSAFKGQSVELAFRFKSDDSENLEGFYLDDVEVAY